MNARRAAGPLVVILLSSVALAVLDASGQAFWQGLVINLGLFIILTVSLNLTSGFTGVFSLGQIGFMALGAYISAILTLPLAEKQAYLPDLPSWLAGVHLDQVVGPFPVGFLLATLIAAVIVSGVAWLVGRVLMRLSGHFVAVATLGFLEVFVTALAGIGDLLPAGSVPPEVRSFLQTILPSGLGSWRDAVVFVILILVLLVRPQGILGRRGPDDEL